MAHQPTLFVVKNKFLDKLTVKLFGEGIWIKPIEIPEKDFQSFLQIAQSLKTHLSDAVTDPYFYYMLKNPKYQSAENITLNGTLLLLNNHKSQIEFWFNRKKIAKLTVADLQNNFTLFPLYETEMAPPILYNTNQMYLEQHETGLLGVAVIAVNVFDIQKVHFQLTPFNNSFALSQITYERQILHFKKSDSLITRQRVFQGE